MLDDSAHLPHTSQILETLTVWLPDSDSQNMNYVTIQIKQGSPKIRHS